jgi:hypothetical protein
MTGQQRIVADVSGNALITQKRKGSFPSHERAARFMLKIVLRDSLNIPLRSSTTKHAGMR